MFSLHPVCKHSKSIFFPKRESQIFIHIQKTNKIVVVNRSVTSISEESVSYVHEDGSTMPTFLRDFGNHVQGYMTSQSGGPLPTFSLSLKPQT
jgi:hypothetical protein